MLRILGLCVATGLLACCAWQEPRRPSILLIAVEGLGFDLVTCGTEHSGLDSGFARICSESVRFTHAYTPSVMSQATLASVFSARFPAEHGVWHNGALYLSEKIETVPEVAVQRGYRTSFFSGGPPIWRKSGLDQGFELFDDHINVDLQRFYRPVKENFDLFLRWLDSEAASRPFLSTIYLPDLQFETFQTESDLGELRSRTHDSQLQEISESLDSLIDGMKRRRRWDNTYVVVMGLNGRNRETRISEIAPLNLHSENTQVFLAIKPATRNNREPVEWSIDTNVTLVDVGSTFYDLIGVSEAAFVNRELNTTSLLAAIERPAVTWSKDRFILTESAWAQWRGVGSSRFSLRQEHFLFLYDEQPLLFNTLIDRFEVSPLSAKDPLSQIWYQKFFAFFGQRKIPAFAVTSHASLEKMKLARRMSFREKSDALIEQVDKFVRDNPWEKQVMGWLARVYLERGDWERLARLGEDGLNPLWNYVAKVNLNEEVAVPNDPCFQALFAQEPRRGECSDELFLSFLDWVKAPAAEKRGYEERFARMWTIYEIDEHVSRLNYRTGLMWDTAVDLPGGPTRVELAVHMPNYRKHGNVIENIRKRIDGG